MIVAWLARQLLAITAGEGEAEYVLGDMAEEFDLIAADRGARAAERWLAAQAAPLVALRIRSGEMAHVGGAGAGASIGSVWLCDRLWRSVHSHIPYKDGLERPAWEIAITLAAIACAIVVAARSAETRRTAMGIVFAAALLAPATAIEAGMTAPLWCAAAACLAAPLVWRTTSGGDRNEMD